MPIPLVSAGSSHRIPKDVQRTGAEGDGLLRYVQGNAAKEGILGEVKQSVDKGERYGASFVRGPNLSSGFGLFRLLHMRPTLPVRRGA